jgi:hypothetical protein
VGALLITLLPHLRNEKRRLPIFYYPSEHDEIMHGLGERHSPHTIFSASAEAKAEHAGSGVCAASVKLAEKQEEVRLSSQILLAWTLLTNSWCVLYFTRDLR